MPDVFGKLKSAAKRVFPPTGSSTTPAELIMADTYTVNSLTGLPDHVTFVHTNRLLRVFFDSQAMKDGEEKTQELVDLILKHHAYSSYLPSRIKVCDRLIDTLWALWNETLDQMALKACIEIEIELRFLLSPSGPGRDRHSARLAASIVPRPSQNYAIKLGDEAVRLGKEFIALQPSDHSKRHISCHNLAALLYERYFQTGDRVLLEDAINFNREALALRPPSHPSRSHSCSSLAMTLLECFSYTGDTAMLKESVRLNEEALELRHVGHPDRHISYSNLASSLRVYFTVTGDEDVLDRAVELSRKVLHLRSVGHQDRYLACSDLATLLHHSYEQTWSVSLLDETIELHKQALSLQPEGSSSQAMLCNELAVSLRSRYQRTGHGALLDEIIQLHREALALRPKPHIRRHITCSALAGSLHDRFRQTGDGDLLYEALQLDREALSLRPVGHPDRAVSCNSLASLLLSRYWQRRDTKILDEAIELQREALALQVVGLPHRDMVCSNLAASLHIRFRETNDDTLLDEAICLEREALGLRPIDHVYRPQSCYRLASYLQLLPGQPSDEISRLLDEAICLCSAEHPIRWRCLAHRAEIALRHNDHTAGISALNDLLSSPTRDIPDLLQASLRLIRDIEPTVLSHSDQQELLKSYGRTLQLVVTTAGFALDRTAQLHQVLNGTEIGPRAYALASQVDNLPAGLELLEHARGVIWSQLLQIRNPEIDRVPRSLSKELSALLRGMTSSSSPAQTTTQLASGPLFLSKLDVHHEQRSRLERILHDIRSFPSLDDFMRGPNSQALLATAARNPVVVLVGHEKDCRALIIKSPKQPLVDIVLDIDLQTLKGLTLTAQQCGSHLNTKGQRLQFSRSKGMSPSHATLAKLWHLVVKPIILQLQLAKEDSQVRPRIHWCPTGAFVFAPVHAAGIYEGPDQECCSDYVISSYTPTLTALLRSQQRRETYTAQNMQVLTIAVERSQDDTLPRLRFVSTEARQIAELAEEAGVPVESVPETTPKSEVVKSFRAANMVHLSCHGIQDSLRPHESRFCLGSGNLTISELIDVDSEKSFFAFLSACETAKGSHKHADEVVHLAASMLFAGFKSVVATMWFMDDEDGPYITKRFYQQIFANKTIDVDAIPRALDSAVTALRNSGAPPERWATFIHMGA